MSQSPNNFNFDDGGFNFPNLEDKTPEELENLSPEALRNLALHQRQLKRLLLYLSGIGLGLGLILAVITVIVLNKLGLTNKPDRPPIPVQQELEQIQFQPNSFEREFHFPSL